jgi:glucosyl-dolichyl phosphate glucuronosyltransferase
MSVPLISVIICTRDRPVFLAAVLNSILAQTAGLDECEIMVVDNGGSGRVGQVVRQSGVEARVVREERQGLSHARNRGAHEARGEYVAYVDDDCLLPRHWCAIATTIARDPAPDLFGGPILPWYVTQQPDWWRDEYASHTPSPEPRPLLHGQFLFGGNLAIRRALLIEMGGFAADLGHEGDRFRYGEDIELQVRYRQRRPAAFVYAHPALHVLHRVRPERMTLAWAVRSGLVEGRDAAAVYRIEQSPPVWRASARLVRSALRLAALPVGALLRDRSRYPRWQNFLHERSGSLSVHLGAAASQLVGRPPQ